MSVMVVLDPRSWPKAERRGLSPRLDGLEGKTIGVLNNGHANAEPPLTAMVEIIKERFPTAQILMRSKPSQRNRAPEEEMQELAEKCDAVLIGVGG